MVSNKIIPRNIMSNTQYYENIVWTSNYSLVSKKTQSYGGIIGYKKETTGKTKHIQQILFRPVVSGTFKYIAVDPRKKKVSFEESDKPIVGKRLSSVQRDILRQTPYASLLKSLMPPLTQPFGGTIMATAVDENGIMREWGYVVGSIQNISSELKSYQIRFSPILFVVSNYIDENDIDTYVIGCIYYKMKLEEIIGELSDVFKGGQIEDALYKKIVDSVKKRFAKHTNQSYQILSTQTHVIKQKAPTDKDIIDFELGLLKKKTKKKVFSLDEKDVIRVLEKSFSYYPSTSDTNFVCKLSSKKEFYNLKHTGFKDKTITEMCPVDTFPKLQNQEMLRNFINPNTQYTGVLVFHGLGTGKTCLAIQVGESFRKHIQQTGKKNLVIVSRSIYENFRKEIYNFNKEAVEKKHNLKRGTLQCTGESYVPPDNMTKSDRIKYRNQILQKYYDLITYGGIKSIFVKIARMFFPPFKMTDFDYEFAQKCMKNSSFVSHIKNIFSDRLVIIDEVHNMRNSSNEDEKLSSRLLEMILHHSERCRLLLLTATPIYNQADEILYILNLLRINDKQKPISQSEQFFGQFDFVSDAQRERFQELWKGHISYLRGENPVNFPRKIFPSTKITYIPSYTYSIDGKKSDDASIFKRFQTQPLVNAKMSEYQYNVYKTIVRVESSVNQSDEGESEKFHLNGRVISNLVYPNPSDDISFSYGTSGFKSCFTSSSVRGPFKPTKNAHVQDTFFLDERAIESFSPKMMHIWNSIKSTPNQLTFIYSEYLQGGILPMCLMLEHHGYTRYSDNNLLSYNRKHASNSKKYILLEGSMSSEKRNQLVDEFNKPDNKNGERIQVILGTRVVGEGIDFKNIRNIHIMNPWYNFSRMDQIIGRGVRHCSHVLQEPEERSVTINIYSASIGKYESTDEYVYRTAFEKDVLFQRIFHALKESAFDCSLNYLANIFDSDKNYSRECAYNKCEINCRPKCELKKVDVDTYHPEQNEQIVSDLSREIISKMDKRKRAHTLKELVDYIFPDKEKFDDIIFTHVMKKLIKEKKILYRGNQYIRIPDNYIESRRMGMNYILHSSQKRNKSIYVPSGLSHDIQTNNMMKTKTYLNMEQIQKHSMEAWIRDMEKTVESYKKFFSSNIIFNPIVYYFMMNMNPYHVISYYMKNTLYTGKDFSFCFSYLDTNSRPPKYYDLFEDALYEFDSGDFKQASEMKKKIFLKNTPSLLPRLSMDDISQKNTNTVYGYIQFNRSKKQYMFKFVDKNIKKQREMKRQVGENCNTWKVESKRNILKQLVQDYDEKLELSNVKIKSNDICILIQYFLYLNQVKRNNTILYLFESTDSE